MGGTVLILHVKKQRLREIKRFKIIRVVNRKVRTWFQVGQPSPFRCCTCHWRGHKWTLIPAKPLQPGTDMQWRGGWSVPCKPLQSPAALPMSMWVYPARQGASLRARSNPSPVTCPHIPTWGFESGRGDICLLCDCAASVLGKASRSEKFPVASASPSLFQNSVPRLPCGKDAGAGPGLCPESPQLRTEAWAATGADLCVVGQPSGWP